ncbi:MULTISPECIES: VOC family protein [unclassified Rathayibacter]|uniref:VOC family protein n=1 Tax=unclassified Rathayibacter TaxID=2609250 RepID=UPI000F4BF658|nr:MULTISPECIES: VOC family protein [unclassified Rathayibacter]ROP49164.1 extradiol dioxygenase family protein [Rathayibacter sp. PhB186]ROS50719.1 extradiol dioxygenase family protein [Rathayibacter sp. PhB185]
MAIRSALLHVADVARSVDFYTRFLGAEVIEASDDEAALDMVTATLRLVRLDTAADSTWIADDLQAGFRHVGFKVSDLDARVRALQEADVPFHLEPIDAEGGVRLTFFYDPDGTLLELVEGPLQYHEVYDRDAVDADWSLGEPERPRFDHIAETVHDLEATKNYFADLGYVLMAGIHQPNDPRGFEIAFLRDGDTSLEIFTYDAAETSTRTPQTAAPGFAGVEFEGEVPRAAEPVGSTAGLDLYADPDGLVHAVRRA